MVNTVVMKLTPPSVDDAPSMNIPDKNAVVPRFDPYWDRPSPRLASVNEEYGGYITQVMSAASPDHIPV